MKMSRKENKPKKASIAFTFAAVGMMLAGIINPSIAEAFLTSNPSTQQVAWSGGTFGWQPVHHTGSNNIRARVIGTRASNRALRMLVEFRSGGSWTGEIGNLWTYNIGDIITTGRLNSRETASAHHQGRGPSSISRTTSITRP